MWIVRQDKFDLGCTATLTHEIALKTAKPIYIKQFKIPDAHHKEVKRHVPDKAWELYLAPLMSSYNTFFTNPSKTHHFSYIWNRATNSVSAGTWSKEKILWWIYSDDILWKLLLACNIAQRNNEVTSEEEHKQFNKTDAPHAFLPDQLVLLDEHNFLAKNQKLAPKFSGPHCVLCLKGECNVEVF